MSMSARTAMNQRGQGNAKRRDVSFTLTSHNRLLCSVALSSRCKMLFFLLSQFE